MLRSGIQMIDTTRNKWRITNPNTTNIPEYTVTTSFKAANQCTHTKGMEVGPVPATYASA